MAKVDLRLDWCSHAAAKYAVEHWHYSKTMPCGKLVKIGVYESGMFIGAVLFGRGANNHIGNPYGLGQTEVCELVRVALKKHLSPVSKIVSISIQLLKKFCQDLRLIVSYADPLQGHAGIIYQAGNWVYTGKSKAQPECLVNGQVIHKRTMFARFGSVAGISKSKITFKLKYLMPLDSAMREQIEPLRQPYPKRAGSETGDTSDDQSEEGGSTPTPALQLKT